MIMSLMLFYFLSILLLFAIIFAFISTLITKRKPKFVHKIHVELVKNHLEQIYNMNTFKDSVHQ